ncbi:TPA: prephenate dehydrogenase/arogenate dehydrogenase family protein [bacterium]|nr:prephenate dehydrogenase/arogenate dehydrogenase family protein [bacterium]
MHRIEQIAIVGCGLIGGSLGLALKKRGLAGKVVGIGRDKTRLLRAMELGVVDEMSTDLREGIDGVKMVVMATPASVILEMTPKLLPHLSEGCVVTDVGSTKGEIVERLTPLFRTGVYFVGGHPIAGSEVTGVEGADGDLFEGATCVLTPINQTDKDALFCVREMWMALGAKVIEMDPSKHDLILGITSHLPHIAAFALSRLASGHQKKYEDLLPLCIGSGFRDTTRIAGSSPILWRDICLSNREVLLDLLDRLKEDLSYFRDLIEKDKSEELLEELRKIGEWRKRF